MNRYATKEFIDKCIKDVVEESLYAMSKKDPKILDNALGYLKGKPTI